METGISEAYPTKHSGPRRSRGAPRSGFGPFPFPCSGRFLMSGLWRGCGREPRSGNCRLLDSRSREVTLGRSPPLSDGFTETRLQCQLLLPSVKPIGIDAPVSVLAVKYFSPARGISVYLYEVYMIFVLCHVIGTAVAYQFRKGGAYEGLYVAPKKSNQ